MIHWIKLALTIGMMLATKGAFADVSGALDAAGAGGTEWAQAGGTILALGGGMTIAKGHWWGTAPLLVGGAVAMQPEEVVGFFG